MQTATQFALLLQLCPKAAEIDRKSFISNIQMHTKLPKLSGGLEILAWTDRAVAAPSELLLEPLSLSVISEPLRTETYLLWRVTKMFLRFAFFCDADASNVKWVSWVDTDPLQATQKDLQATFGPRALVWHKPSNTLSTRQGRRNCMVFFSVRKMAWT